MADGRRSFVALNYVAIRDETIIISDVQGRRTQTDCVE